MKKSLRPENLRCIAREVLSGNKRGTSWCVAKEKKKSIVVMLTRDTRISTGGVVIEIPDGTEVKIRRSKKSRLWATIKTPSGKIELPRGDGICCFVIVCPGGSTA